MSAAPTAPAVGGPSDAERTRAVPAALVATVLWSGGNLLVKATSFSGPQLAFWRTLCGATVYHLVWRARGGRMSFATIRTAAVGGLGFGLQASLFFTALQTTTVTTAAVIAALQPIMLVPMAGRLYGEVIDRRRLVLTVAAMLGTGVVVGGASSRGHWSAQGDLLALAATFVGCFYFTGTKSARATLDTVEYQAAALTVAAMTTLPAAFVLEGHLVAPRGPAVWWPLLMTLVPGTGHLLMSWSQRRLSVATTSTIALAVTPLTALGSSWWFGERLGALQLCGMGVVVISLGFFVRSASAV